MSQNVTQIDNYYIAYQFGIAKRLHSKNPKKFHFIAYSCYCAVLKLVLLLLL